MTSVAHVQADSEPGKPPWRVAEWQAKPPLYAWLDGTDAGDRRIRGLMYEGEPCGERATKVFAWYGSPESPHGPKPRPAMLLVHGGGGRAFSEWVRLWVDRGYAALAMDLGGCGPDGTRHKDAGPNQDHAAKFDSIAGPADSHWCLHAAAAVIRAHSLLASFGEIDAERIGLTGISWGGFLTCLVAGLDERTALAMPVYGCGFIHENSCWLELFAKMSAVERARWVNWYEPSRHLDRCICPMLFVTGTNDFAYPPDSLMQTFAQPRGPKQLCVRVGMEHGHKPGWAPEEPFLFADHVLRGGEPLPRMTDENAAYPTGEAAKGKAGYFSARVIGGLHGLCKPQLHYTCDATAWQTRAWHARPAQLAEDDVLSASVPEGISPTAAFLSIEDTRGVYVSGRMHITP